MTRHRPPVLPIAKAPRPRGAFSYMRRRRRSRSPAEGGAGGRTLPPAYWPHGSPRGWWCRWGTMPGGQARMSGSPPQRRSKRCSHSRLTACPAPRRLATGGGGWWDAPSARAASLASSAALPRPPGDLAHPAGGGRRPLRQWVRQPLRHSLRAGGAYPWLRWLRVSVQLSAPSGGQSAAKTAADWPPLGEWCGRTERCASRD